MLVKCKSPERIRKDKEDQTKKLNGYIIWLVLLFFVGCEWAQESKSGRYARLLAREIKNKVKK